MPVSCKGGLEQLINGMSAGTTAQSTRGLRETLGVFLRGVRGVSWSLGLERMF